MPDAPAGAVPGGSGVGVGVPPMMPPVSPGGSGGGPVGDRSDASGLLGGPDAWGGDGVEVGLPDAPAGAVPGGAGGPSAALPPMSPGSPGGGSVNERVDAADLLGGSDAWSADGPEADAPEDAVPGGFVVGAGGSSAGMPPGSAGGGSAGARSNAAGQSGAPVPAETTRMSIVEQWEEAVMPMVLPPVTEDEAAVRSRASEHLREEPVAWVGGEELPLDRVAVVRREDVEDDTGAWDVAGAGVAWLTPLAVAGSRDAQRDGSAGLRLCHLAPCRHREGTARGRAASLGGPILTAEELAENQAEEAPPPPEEEEIERTSADLLTRDDSAWVTEPRRRQGCSDEHGHRQAAAAGRGAADARRAVSSSHEPPGDGRARRRWTCGPSSWSCRWGWAWARMAMMFTMGASSPIDVHDGRSDGHRACLRMARHPDRPAAAPSASARCASERRDYLRYLAQLRRQARHAAAEQRAAACLEQPATRRTCGRWHPASACGSAGAGTRTSPRSRDRPRLQPGGPGPGAAGDQADRGPRTALCDLAAALHRGVPERHRPADHGGAAQLHQRGVRRRRARPRWGWPRALLGQLVTFHAPDELRIAVLTDDGGAHRVGLGEVAAAQRPPDRWRTRPARCGWPPTTTTS